MERLPVKTMAVPFANDGQKNDIPPDSTDPTTPDASYKTGFKPVTMVPRVAGGEPPLGQDFNGIFFDITTFLKAVYAGQTPKFDQTFSDAVGGYPKDAVLQSDDGLKSYVSTIDNNTINFNTDPTSIGDKWKPFGGGSEGDRRALTAVDMIAPNAPTPQGWVNISYTNVTCHPILGSGGEPGIPQEFLDAYYCGNAKNATAGFGYRCNNIDGTGRNTTGNYLAFEPAANYFIRCLDPTGARDPFQLHSDMLQNITGRLGTTASGDIQLLTDLLSSLDIQEGSLYVTQDGRTQYTIQNGGSSGAGIGSIWLDASRTARTGTETVPKHIDKKFIMKVFDGAVGDPALVDWQAWFDAFTDLQASKVDRTEFTGSNQSLNEPDGFQNLPGGLILQWATTQNVTSVTFPIPFPNKCLSVVNRYGGSGTTASPDNYFNILTPTRTGFTRSNGTVLLCYLAIGC